MTRRDRTAHFDLERMRARQVVAAPEVKPRARSGPLRLALFAVIVLGVGGAAIGLVANRLATPVAADASALQVRGSMSGLEPMALTVKAGQVVKLELTSLDTPFHSDGGGWHQFKVDELGIDFKVGPESSEVFEFTAPTTPGTYTYYCDICCGGKENPTMVGSLTVTA
ncbi:MAG: cupredoxin domain-containing protein [Anaerolinea sp.]|nr:cupredoxin domain-containing protein [Anaerolinea sp.]